MKLRPFVPCAVVALLSPLASPTAALALPHRPTSCTYTDTASPAVRTAGFRGTNVTSYQVSGPYTIDYTVTRAAAQSFGASATIGFDVGLFIAKAHTTFGVNYSYTTTATQAWGYHTTIPSGRTGLMAVLHSTDRVSYTETIHYEDCSTARRTGYAYIPLSSTSNLTFCLIRDLAPYSYSLWRPTCKGE
jgi:hypothetical protein